MIKTITNDFDWGETSVKLINAKLIKEAASSEAKEFFKLLEPDENYFYVLVIALGAGEYWGANKNGDYFPEQELLKAYKTFEEGHAFIQHQNHDPSKAVGKVLKAFWNDRMKRVELVVRVDRQKATDVLERLQNGETVDVSMGCKVEYDVCSICGNRARTRAEYCEHLLFHMNEILPDGRQVYAINPNPTFFDISFVRRGADPTAKVLEKAAGLKESEIEKEVPGMKLFLINEPTADEIDALESAFWSAPDLPDEVIERLSRLPLGDVICTLTLLNIQLKPHELIKLLGPGIYLETPLLKHAMIGSPSEKVYEVVKHIVPQRSLHKIRTRVKTARQRKPDSLIYDVYQQAMWENMIKCATAELNAPFLSRLWFALARLLRMLIMHSSHRGLPTDKEIFQQELKRWREKPWEVGTPYYKFAEHSTFLVPGYWYTIAQKLVQGGKSS